ncbi:zf-C2H2 type zinc finger protein [Schizosaccharomyces cryophilus OY26]|uniref:Zf-C2H2 type zinc finger protein n=1 Tax=Schizosaccharomyces cryophilus (strain OY26 / ATCC MYA-4695 / CBS 11777 / NBRC 106824 / NRRL Y48691) TaxID=653667 RepID=S9WXF4_SCHCR|nr:zf-C2H2 type zinc finger protein [Schizosaccharomyces cryophilus OY26]EPY49337.1 zf-C2H2 type zinc finger protein [Schizosaccharomyces cryophilus OY26]
MSDIEQTDNRETTRWRRDKIRRRSQSPSYNNGAGSHRERSPVSSRDTYRDEHYEKRPRVIGPQYTYSRSINDPYSQESVISYERFIRWYSQENSISATTEDLYKSLHGTYNNYKQDLYARTAKKFVQDHCDEAWFEDAYWFDESQGRLREISGKEKSYRLSMHNIFLERLENGYYDAFKLPNEQDIPTEVKNMNNETNPELFIKEVPYFKYLMDSRELAKDKTLLIRHVLPDISMSNMHEVFDNIDIIEYFSVSRMKFTKNFERSVWVHLKPDVAIEGAKEILDGVQLASNYAIETESAKFPRNHVPTPLPSNFSSNDICKKILSILFKVMNRFVVMYNLPQDISEKLQDKVYSVPIDVEDEIEKERMHNVQLCDLLVEYLRQVATFDFWTCRSYSSLIALLQDNPAGYSRKSYDDTNEASQEESWFSNLESDYTCLLDPESVDLKSKGALPIDTFVNSEIESVILKEDDQKYRCHVGACTKLFLGPEFVKKHISKKHSEWLDHVKKVAICLRNYVLDPGRVMDPKVVSPSYAAQHLANKSYPVSYFGNSGYDRRRNGLEFEDSHHTSYQKPYHRQDSYTERRDQYKDYRDLDAPTQEIPELDY